MAALPPIPRDIEKLAIICPSWVGDTVMATPLLRAARAARPGVRIVGVMRPGLEEVLAGTPWIDEMIVGETKTTRGMLRIARSLRGARPDAALLLPNSFRSALMARLGGCPHRVGYLRYGRSVLLSRGLQPARPSGPVPTLDYYKGLGEWALGVEGIEPRMELAVTDAERAAAERLLEGVARPLVVLCPGANKPPKRWPPQRFAAVADALASDPGLASVATGAPAEKSVVRQVVEQSASGVRDLAERGTTLGALKAVIARARLMITNDTGPRHIAAALGVPVVTLFGATDPRWTTINCPHERQILADPFLPEELTADDHPDRCAITRIAVGDVLSAARQLLGGPAPQAPEGHDASPAPTTAG